MRKRTLINAFAVLLCVLLTVPASFAQQAPARGGRGADDLTTFKQELSGYYAEMQQVLTALAQFEVSRASLQRNGGDAAVATLAKDQRDLGAMTTYQLLELKTRLGSGEQVMRLRATARQLNALLQDRGVRAVLSRLDERNAYERNRGKNAKDASKAKAGESEGLNPNVANVVIPDTCPPAALTPSLADLAVLEAIVIAAEAVMEGFPTDGLTILARLVPIAAVAAAKGVELAARTFYEQDQNCKADKFENDVFTQFTLQERLQIEANLANNNLTLPIGTFLLPASQGGSIEKVRAIVSDLITKMGAIGVSTAGASSLLAAADAAISSGNYKSAYQNLRDAYQNLIQ